MDMDIGRNCKKVISWKRAHNHFLNMSHVQCTLEMILDWRQIHKRILIVEHWAENVRLVAWNSEIPLSLLTTFSLCRITFCARYFPPTVCVCALHITTQHTMHYSVCVAFNEIDSKVKTMKSVRIDTMHICTPICHLYS